MGVEGWRLVVEVFVVVVLFWVDSSFSELAPNYTFLHQATTSPATAFYDYIIVGGGTAGCPLAATLSRSSTVLLLERGGVPYGNSNITKLASFSDTLADNSPKSPSQRFVSEDGVVNARARVLGGGTCLNAGFYTQAGAEYVRKAGWDARLVNDSYKWVERLVAHKPPMLQWQSALRDGLLEAGVEPSNGFTYDHLFGTKVGGSIFDANGTRHTAADLLEYADEERLTVLLHATVHHILFKRKGKSKPVAYGVAFRDESGAKHKAYLNKDFKGEIILAAGALGSPQLLMLSGIGPAEHLKSLGIHVVVDQPMVGQGMADNPMNAIFVPSPSPVEISLIQVVGITRLGTYIEGASGANFANQAGGLSSQIEQLSTLTRTSKQTPGVTESLDDATFRGGFILEKIVGPLSTGHLKLKNRNPTDNPTVTFNYFKDPRDLRRCVDGMKTIAKVIESKSFSKFRYPDMSVGVMINLTAAYPVNLRPKHDNDSTSMEQYCMDTVMTIWHYHGGCQVGRVVDEEYKVLGVDALRVVDGSTFNFSPGTNPQATVMMLGRYMGIKILEERLKHN